MSRRPARTTDKDPTPLDKKQHALKAQAEELKAQLSQARQFLKEAPGIKAEVQRKEQQEILNSRRRPARIEGPADFRLELVNSKPGAKPRVLRKERSMAPLLTVVLAVACCVVFYYAMRTLANG